MIGPEVGAADAVGGAAVEGGRLLWMAKPTRATVSADRIKVAQRRMDFIFVTKLNYDSSKKRILAESQAENVSVSRCIQKETFACDEKETNYSDKPRAQEDDREFSF
jgi:hypothetical protein